jgi:hypothetical protein
MKKYINIVVALFIFSACVDLNETVYDGLDADLYPENPTQVANLTTDAYKRLGILIDDGGGWYLAQLLSSDELVGPTRAGDWDDGGKWRILHQHGWESGANDFEATNNMWSAMWSGVTTCNMTKEMLEMMAESDAINTKIAELNTLRSFFYYIMMDNYGSVPYLTSAKDAPEKPVKIPRAEVFDSITTSLLESTPKLELRNSKYMATRTMAYALLAKLYLNAEVYTGTPQWALAEQFCDSVIASGFYTMSERATDPFVTENQTNPEIIFSIPFDEDDFDGFRLHMRTLHYQMNLKFDMPVGPWNGFAATKLHFDRYSDNDLRKSAYMIYGPQFKPDGTVIIDGTTQSPLNINPVIPALNMDASFTAEQIRMSGARVGKYEIKKGAKENLSNDFVIFRITDIYLMKAEAQLRQGKAIDATTLAAINKIRTRAGLSPHATWDIQKIEMERALELFVEGHRRQDQIRFGTFLSAWWEKPATTKTALFPIPKWAIDANENLAQ